MGTITQSVTLVPSGYTGNTNFTADSTYGPTNGYSDATSTTYARWTLPTSTTGYVYYTFDTSEIPATATISSVTARVKARVSSTSRVTNTVAQLYSNTTAKGSNRTFASTTASTQNITAGSWTRSELNSLRIRIGGTGSSSSSSKRVDFYGADVTITYTITSYDISVTNNSSGTVTPTGTTTVAEDKDFTVTITATNKPTITDNGIDVSAQLVELPETTGAITASGYENLSSGITINSSYPITRAYDSADDTSDYARLNFNTSTTGYIELTFDIPTLPSGATLTNISARARLRISSTSRMTNRVCQLYAGTTAKGSNTNFSSTESGGALINLTTGSWSISELTNLKMRIGATSSSSTNSKYIYIYGADITINYEAAEKEYTYTISNIAADHTIIIGSGSSGSTSKIYLKENGTWVEYSKVYKKINGSWVEQSDISGVFSTSANYVKGN